MSGGYESLHPTVAEPVSGMESGRRAVLDDMGDPAQMLFRQGPSSRERQEVRRCSSNCGLGWTS